MPGPKPTAKKKSLDAPQTARGKAFYVLLAVFTVWVGYLVLVALMF